MHGNENYVIHLQMFKYISLMVNIPKIIIKEL